MLPAQSRTRPFSGPVQLRLDLDPPALDPAPVLPPLSAVAPADALFVRHRRARRYVLSLTPDGRPRVTIPRGGSKQEAVAFLAEHGEWIARERHRHAALQRLASRAWAAGDRIWFRGAPTTMRLVDDMGRCQVAVGTHVFDVGDEPDLRAAVERSLRTLATAELPNRLRGLAALHGLSVGRITIRDQRARWGSCSPSGAISLNWRLVQVPDEVRDYVLIHELMHLRRADHSRRFWRLVHDACPWHLEARRWLRRHGHQLHQPLTERRVPDVGAPAPPDGEEQWRCSKT